MSPSRRRALARCAAWQVAHAESFACRGSVRDTVRGRAAHPARWSPRTHATVRHGGRARCPHRAAALWRGGAPSHPAPLARAPPRRIARGGSPPRCAAWHPTPRRNPKKSPAVVHRLCAPIQPVPSLFVPLCVQNSHSQPALPQLASCT